MRLHFLLLLAIGICTQGCFTINHLAFFDDKIVEDDFVDVEVARFNTTTKETPEFEDIEKFLKKQNIEVLSSQISDVQLMPDDAKSQGAVKSITWLGTVSVDGEICVFEIHQQGKNVEVYIKNTITRDKIRWKGVLGYLLIPIPVVLDIVFFPVNIYLIIMLSNSEPISLNFR